MLTPPPATAQESARSDGMRFVPDVEGQFRALADHRADALGLRIGGSPDPSLCRHYQAITRIDGPDGTPFFLTTRSGNTPFPPGEIGCDDSDGETRNGHLIVFRMDSREKNGERLRSNRLRKGAHVNSTAPPPEDKASIYFTVVENGLVFQDGDEPPVPILGRPAPPRVYQHPGGMQLVGHMLALAVEAPRQFAFSICSLVPIPVPECEYERAESPTQIMFFDVRDPEAPVFKSRFPLVHPNGDPFEKAGVVAITPLPNNLYLMAVTGGDGETVHFFRSTIGDLTSPELSWQFVNTTSPEVDDDPLQTLQFLRQGDINGQLYIAGVRGHPAFGSDHDKADLYSFNCQTPNCEPGETLEQPFRFRGRVITTFPNTGGERLANGAAASGYHVTPTGELILYVTEHDNDGPSGTVKAGEWRHIDMVRPGSPTFFPSADVNGPYDVDEGSSVALTGSASPAVTKAFIQLFHETEFRAFYPVIDYPDRELDDFDNLFALEPQIIFQPPPNPPTLFHHGDKARSWKWYAPPGCSIQAIDHDDNGNVDEIRTLTNAVSPATGLPEVQSDPDLTQVLNDGGTDDIDQEIDAVDFLDDCDAYYSAPIGLFWDLNLDGIFDATGSPVTFNATAFDGPSDVNVPAEARHPSGGPVGSATARVTVRNVAPAITQFRLTDSAGNEINSVVPFVLVGLPVTLSALYSDPGVLDHQTAAIAWGDGANDPNAAFAIFDEAFGDGAGALSHQHVYAASGSFPIVLIVADDDGGVDTETAVVRVLTPEEAVEELIDMLDDLIASTTDNGIRKDLEKARKALAGNPNGSNGALEKIRNGNDQAAIAFLRQAIKWLERAQEEGANVATLIALLQQVVAALSNS
jgi:hypothetical protein